MVRARLWTSDRHQSAAQPVHRRHGRIPTQARRAIPRPQPHRPWPPPRRRPDRTCLHRSWLALGRLLAHSPRLPALRAPLSFSDTHVQYGVVDGEQLGPPRRATIPLPTRSRQFAFRDTTSHAVRHDYPVAETDYAVLNVPRDHPPADSDSYLRAAIAWHFGKDTGSPFWLRAATTLGLDPRTDVHSFTDLRRFPNLVDELRDVPVEDLIPRGYGCPPPVPRVFESGGTTGAPKRTAQLPDWVEQVTRWQIEDCGAGGFVAGQGLLCLMPSGPHGVGYFDQAVADRLGSVFYPIDLDPRWVKKLTAQGKGADAYVDHVLDQARVILESQS